MMRGQIARDLQPGDRVALHDGSVTVERVTESWWPGRVTVTTDQRVFHERAFGYVWIIED